MIATLLKIFSGVLSLEIISVWSVSLWRYKKKNEQIFKYPALSLSYALLAIGVIDCVAKAVELLLIIIGGILG